MKEFDDLWSVACRLHGEGGCPWDREQTFFSLQPYVLEEAHEVIEAVDGGDNREIAEELGDLLYTVLFYAKLAETEKRFSLADILSFVKEKLIRRHPHVFGSISVETQEEIGINWDKIKKEERRKKGNKGALDGIPDTLPALSKAQKMIRIFRRARFSSGHRPEGKEEEIASRFWDLIREAEESGIDSETVLRRKILQECVEFQKIEFREEEKG